MSKNRCWQCGGLIDDKNQTYVKLINHMVSCYIACLLLKMQIINVENVVLSSNRLRNWTNI